jgi:hypothetical protein
MKVQCISKAGYSESKFWSGCISDISEAPYGDFQALLVEEDFSVSP